MKILTPHWKGIYYIIVSVMLLLSGIGLSGDVILNAGAITGRPEVTGETIVWSGTIHITEDVNVPEGTDLVVEPGTEVEIDYSKNIYVHGNIWVNGTEESPVTFQCATPQDRWGSLHIYSDRTGNHINHTLISQAQYGVRGDGAKAQISNSQFEDCKYAIGAVAGSDLTIKNTTMDNSMYYSLYAEGSSLNFSGVVIGNRGQGDMYLNAQDDRGCLVRFIDGEYNFNLLDIKDSKTEVYRCWSTGIEVRDELGLPVAGAGVSFERNDLFEEFAGVTTETGAIDGIILPEIMYREVGPQGYNPFTLTVEKEGYLTHQDSYVADSFREIPVTLFISNEAPGLVEEIPTLYVDQNSPDTYLLDIRTYFVDDWTSVDNMTYSINYNSHPENVDLFIRDDYYLTINTSRDKLFNGMLSSKLIAADEEGLSTTSNNFYIMVEPVPLPPEIVDFPDFELQEGEALLTALFLFEYIDDPDTGYDELLIWISDNSHGENVSVLCSDNILKIVPLEQYSGDGMVEISATDGNYTVSHRFHINVTPINDPPELHITSPLQNDVVLADLWVEGSVQDIDGDPLTLTISAGELISTHSVVSDFSLNFDLSTLGGQQIELMVSVSDGQVTTSMEITITVVDPNLPDTDGDGLPDDHDNDDDDDTFLDENDDFPTDPAASLDSDGDGYPDNWNVNRSAKDSTLGLELDMFPDNSGEWSDADGDGFGDNGDAFPDDPAASQDADGDGFPSRWNDGMGANDSTTSLRLDAFPVDGAASLDSDGDGYPDGWNDGRDEGDSIQSLRLDLFPYDPTRNGYENDASGNSSGSEGNSTVGQTPGFGLIDIFIAGSFCITLLCLKRRKESDMVD